MPLPSYFFSDHEPFYGPAPVPNPPPITSFNLHDIVKMLRKLIRAFSSPKSRRIDNRAIQAFYTMNAEVCDHPFFWCWYIDRYASLSPFRDIICDKLSLEVTAYRSWSHDEDIPILLTRLRMHRKTLEYLRSAPFYSLQAAEYNQYRYGVNEIILRRPKQLDGKAKVVAKGLQTSDAEDVDEVECTICMERFDVEEGDRNHDPVVTTCGHIYGHDCLVKWLSKHETCPMCRYKIFQPCS